MTAMSVHASVNLYDRVLRHMWFSPMSFFDTQPLGRLMGVFGKDMDSMDNELAELVRLLVLLVANVRSGVEACADGSYLALLSSPRFIFPTMLPCESQLVCG